VNELTDESGAPTAPKLAKAAAKTVAKEIGSAASDEAKELGMAATRKVKQLGERRRQKRAERHHATEAAMRLADELGVDLDHVEGSGADGRIVVSDVRDAAEED
jgi:pyruvate/2-oxoglutarate dehydrogenase complex dihydrolipoamide acyltransferase (E2) component